MKSLAIWLYESYTRVEPKSLTTWLYESYAQGYGEKKNKIEVAGGRSRGSTQHGENDPWTAQDLSVLANQHLKGSSIDLMAATLGRPRTSVEAQLRRLGY